jgi:hypothetical protein
MKTVEHMRRTERRITQIHLNRLLDTDPNQAVREAHTTLGQSFTDMFAKRLYEMGRNQAFRRTLKELLKRPKVVQIDSFHPMSARAKAA